MNNQKVYSKRNLILKNFKNISGSHSNCIKINSHNTKEHELRKFLVAFELIKSGCEIFTEIELKSGGICDILCIDRNSDALIYEIVNTETEESLEDKKTHYPYEIIEVKA